MLAILIALVVTSLAYFLVLRFSTARVAPSDPFQRMQVVRLTNSGKAMSAIVSPDGKYIAHVLDEDGQQGLWLRQVATASSVPIVPAMDIEYWGLTFSPDANYIYYVAWQPNMADAELFRVPTLGGAAEKLVSAGAAIGTPISFAPDGRRLAYLSGRSHETRLVVAKADGTEPRVLALRKDPDSFPMFGTGPAWSPDGSAIACAGAVPGTQGMQNSLVVVRVEDASQEAIGTARWNQVGRIAWLPDSSGLVVTASADRWSPRQIWHVSYPDGSARRVTNDLNQYNGVSITRDARMLVAVQTGSLAGIWVMPTAQPALGKRVASEVERYDGIEGMAWTPDGKLLYRSKVSGNWDLWLVDPDRGDPRRVTFDSTSELHPALPADGEQLVFSSDRTGRMHLWTMPLDRRTGPVQLTNGPDEEVYPQVSSDRRWVVYQEGFSWFRPVSIWKVPISGGKPQRLAAPTSLRPAISPDGRLVAYFRLEHGRWGIHLIPIAGGPPIQTFNIPASSSRILRWTPDGEAVAYVVTSQGVSTIWKQAITGASPEPVSDFQPDRVFDFVWSPEGKRLAIVRGVDTSDIVSIAVPWK